MYAGHEPRLTTADDATRQLQLLANVEPSDAPFLSCSLDVSADGSDAGRGARRAFIERRVDELRRDLPAHQRVDLDAALVRLRQLLDGPLHPQARGLLVYLRGEGGGRFDLAMQVAAPVGDSLLFYPVPDLQPLLRLLEGGRLLTVLLRPGWLQVQELNLGATSVRQWMALPRDRALTPGQGVAGRIVGALQRQSPGVGFDGLYLVGDATRIAELRACLPQRLQQRVLGDLPLAPHKTEEDLAATLLTAERQRQQSLAVPALTRLLRALGSRGPAVGGGPGVREGLQSGRAGLLLMDNNYHPGPLSACRWCGAPALAVADREQCAECGSPVLQPLDLRVELLRLAVQKAVPVQFVDSPELAYLGGVGCLLQPRPQARVQAPPRLPAKPADVLRLVA